MTRRVTRHVSKPTHAQLVQQQKVKAQQLALHKQQLAQQGLVSPYDGTSPIGGVGARPGLAGMPGITAGLLNGQSSAHPQVNATNQSALAPNGDINQSVTNNNHYENRYINVITSPMYGVGGGFGSPFGVPGIGGYNSNSFVDPQTGVMYTRQDSGIVGWFKRLLRGY